MLDAMFEAETNRVLDDMQARPRVPKPASVGVWAGFGSAGPKGVASGGMKAGATLANVVEGFGTVVGAYDPFGATVINRSDPERVKVDRDEAIAKISRNELLQSDTADELRRMARRVRPDADTTGVAGQILFGVTDMVTQATLGLAVGGAPGAAATVAAGEGGATYDELISKGVDKKTAAKIAGIHAAASGATVALPVAGQTIKQTAALIAAGGPGMYMAEMAASKAILKAADYSDIADTYDPFDPLGLAISTFAAGAFGAGAHAARGRIRNNSEAVDAARVVLARETDDSLRLAEPTDIAATAAETKAIETAEIQLARGEDVAVDAPSSARAEAFGEQVAKAVERAEPEAAPPITITKSVGPDPLVARARAALREVDAGKPLDEVLAGAPPELNNMALALKEFGNDADAFLDRVSAFRAANKETQLHDVIADAADSMRVDPKGELVPGAEREATPMKPEDGVQAATQTLLREAGDMEVEIDGTRLTVADAVARIEQRLAEDTDSSRLFEVAANCMLGV